MLDTLSNTIEHLLKQKAPTTGLGLTRIFYGLVLLQEILFLIYFNHLIFDPIPYLDVEFPLVTFFLGIWAIIASCLVLGYKTQFSTISNYIFWLVFVSFTPMQRDFDGGFDQFMTGVGFFFIFLPVQRSFSIDNLLQRLDQPNYVSGFQPCRQASVLCYLAPVTICLGFLYLDSVIHKVFAPHWLNGLGAWLPLTQPYYISVIDFSWLLDLEYLQKAIGYAIIVFQFCFLLLYFSKRFRPLAFLFGISLHTGITLGLNIYPFGLGMLALYPLVAPFRWWRVIAEKIKHKAPLVSVYYDEQCPLCNRTAIIINHFDIFSAVQFKGLQTEAHREPLLSGIPEQTLLTDLYAVDNKGKLYSGLDTYISVLKKMGYLWLPGVLLTIPGVYHISQKIYRKIADNRTRLVCDATCYPNHLDRTQKFSLYNLWFETLTIERPKLLAKRLSKLFVFILILQLNSTIHYGLVYRLEEKHSSGALTTPLRMVSNSLLTLTSTFLGITPHALYLNDHFEGYEHILGITYIGQDGNEKWLPFINEEGRIIAPNWGRVHSMWANVAVTPNIDQYRLTKLLKKVTAFWGIKTGLDLDRTRFIIKLKKIRAPSHWIENLRYNNSAQPWHDIGYAQWVGKSIYISLPDNIELL